MNKDIKDKLLAWVKEQNDTVSIGPYIVGAAIMIGFLMLVGCAKPGHQKGDTYRVMLGNKCAKGGTIQSYVWLHTTIGPDQVSAKNCDAKN